jgi:hypothetical protein
MNAFYQIVLMHLTSIEEHKFFPVDYLAALFLREQLGFATKLSHSAV